MVTALGESSSNIIGLGLFDAAVQIVWQHDDRECNDLLVGVVDGWHIQIM
jgi:hypothetical protein